MSECNGTCGEHNRFMEDIYEMKADQKYMKATIDRIEETLTKFIDGDESKTRKIATEVATSLVNDCKVSRVKTTLEERKFSWARITWTVALITSVAGNIMNWVIK